MAPTGYRISVLPLTLATQKKDARDIAVFLKDKPDLLRKIEAQAKRPLKDATVVNATRWALFEKLKTTGLPVEVGSGGRTQILSYNAGPSQRTLGRRRLPWRIRGQHHNSVRHATAYR